MDLGLAGATAVVSGGSRGMGRAVAESLAKEVARVAVLARNQKELRQVVDALGDLGSPDALGIPTDLTSWEAVESAFDAVGKKWGALNVLVNAAGPVDVGIGSFEQIDDVEWHDTFDIGTLSAVRSVRAALPSCGWRRGGAS